MLMAAGLDGAHAASSATAGCSSAARRCRSRSSPASRPSRSPTSSAPTRSATTSCARSRSARTARSRWEDLAARYQAELANGFGNLASRVIAMIERYFDGVVPAAGRVHRGRSRHPADGARMPRPPPTRRSSASRSTRRSAAIWTIVDALNGYITERGAVGAREGRGERASASARCSYTAAEGLRALAVLLSPVMPKATEKLWTALGGARRRARSSASTAPREWTGRRARRAARGRCSRASRRRRGVTGSARPTFATRVRRLATPEAAASSTRPLPEPLVGAGLRQPHAPRDRRRRRLPLDVREQLDRAAAVGVRGVVQVGTDVATSRWSAEVAAREPRRARRGRDPSERGARARGSRRASTTPSR